TSALFSSEMTPQKRFNGKSSTGSQYSNGYNTGAFIQYLFLIAIFLLFVGLLNYG
ncbi:hypothetical protein CEXT_330731, partial [Caerostris extrusa]